MAILNRAHNDFHGEQTGFFGFFDVENDKEASTALFDAAAAWLRSRGAKSLRGPYNPSTNYEIALLVEGFEEPPAIMMTYNYPYYVDLIEGYGFQKAMDLYTYSIDVKDFVVRDKLTRVSERVKTRQKIRIRKVNMKDYESEVARIREIYNDAWSANWGFVPVSEEEFAHLAKDMKQIVNPNIVFIAEQEIEGSSQSKPIGFMLAVPDLNRALKKLNGRLLPFGIFKLLWHSRRVGAVRVITTGVVREHQSLGVASVFYEAIYREAPANGYPGGEVGWVLETNVLMNRVIEVLGARRNKTYRIYEVAL
jgi:GNAT superfamily N-acetyltransferase